MKHTPGPWQIKRTLEEERFTIWDKEHRLLAVAYNQDLDHKGPDGCVRAIAAAPDMEACLRLMLEAQKEKDASRRERNEAAFMVALVKERDAYQLAEALLKRIEGDDVE